MINILKAEDISFSFGSNVILSEVNFICAKGDVFAVTGKSGAGKTTLFEICSSIRKPVKGNIWWDEFCINNFDRMPLMELRKNIGVVFQKHALIHNFTIYDNIALPLRYHKNISEGEIKNKVRDCMEEFGLYNIDNKYPNELSNAQARKAALTRALVMEPSILFLDEPTFGLDPFTERAIANVFLEKINKKGIIIFMTSSSINFIKLMKCKNIKVLDNGKLYDYNDEKIKSLEYFLDFKI